MLRWGVLHKQIHSTKGVNFYVFDRSKFFVGCAGSTLSAILSASNWCARKLDRPPHKELKVTWARPWLRSQPTGCGVNCEC